MLMPELKVIVIDGLQYQLHDEEPLDKLHEAIKEKMASDDKLAVMEVKLTNGQLLLNCRRLRYVYVGTRLLAGGFRDPARLREAQPDGAEGTLSSDELEVGDDGVPIVR